MGFTYSEIFGLAIICISPKLIAAYHVLHRLPAPRHSLCALYNLISLTLLKSAICLVLLSFAVFPKYLITKSFFNWSLRPSLGTASILYLFLYPVCSCQRTFLFLRLRRQGFWLSFLLPLCFHFFRSAGWWTQLDLNQRPPPYQGGALTN